MFTAENPNGSVVTNEVTRFLLYQLYKKTDIQKQYY